jgi:hypothetical protein
MQPSMKTIFFTSGMVPTAEEYAEAEKIGLGVVFRNARKIVPGAPLENCDAVAGAVPPDYAIIYSGKPGDTNKNIYIRPNAVRVGNGGPDDHRPGTVHDGLAHESGTGSSFSGDPYAERAEQRTIDQRAGKQVWEKNPEREPQEGDASPLYGVNMQRASVPAMGAWPTKGAPAKANIEADGAPAAAKAIAEPMKQAFADAAEHKRESDNVRASNAAEAAHQQQAAAAGTASAGWPSQAKAAEPSKSKADKADTKKDSNK